MVLVAAPVWAQTLRAHILDVGQGSAAILETECAAVLVDTGGESNELFDSTAALLEKLEEFFQGRPHLNRTFDLLVLSHPHVDHTRGVEAVLKNYTIRNAVTNGRLTGHDIGMTGQKALHRFVAKSEEGPGPAVGLEPVMVDELPQEGLSNEVISPIECGSVRPKLTALWGTADAAGWPQESATNQNNHSVVIRVDFGSSSMLLTGDLENRGIAGLLARYRNTTLLDVDVYLVGHHGADNATTPPLLAAITPRIAVISMGSRERMLPWTAWKYGHPRKTIVAQLHAAVSQLAPARSVMVAKGVQSFEKLTLTKAIYATGWDGTIVLEGDTVGNWRLVHAGAQDAPNIAMSIGRVSAVRGKLNLNTATVDQLDALPMIGLKRAKDIVAYREVNGAYGQVSDLLKVHGIGMGTVKAIRRLVEAR